MHIKRTLPRSAQRLLIWGAAGLIFALFSFKSDLYADSNPGNDAGAMQISISPRADRGVLIDTSAVNLNMGIVDLGVSTQTVSPATVTILGNLIRTELTMSAQITGGWTFDENVSASTETDKLAVWALFKDTDSATVPAKAGSNFDDSQDSFDSATVSFGPVRIGQLGGDGGNDDRFEDGISNMDNLFPGTKRHLWFYFNTPPTTSVTTEQEIRFTISTAHGP